MLRNTFWTIVYPFSVVMWPVLGTIRTDIALHLKHFFVFKINVFGL